MIPNLRMDYYHQKEYLERPYNIQAGEKLTRKPLKVSTEGFEYSSLLASKTYSIPSYIVGGFVGSKIQMNNNKHNLSYDLSAAIFNLLNPCKYEREKGYRRNNDNFCNTTSKISTEGYDKYIVKSSQKEKMIDLGLEWIENYMLGFQECYNCSQIKEDSFNCDEEKISSDSQISLDINKLENCLNNSVDMTDQVPVFGVETTMKENLDLSVNCLITKRFRQYSECSIESTDSENFIFFENSDQDDEKRNEKNWKLENFDFDSEDENDDDDDDDDEEEDEDEVNDVDEHEHEDEDDDTYDICSIDKELAEANDKWKRNYENTEIQNDIGQRKVRFNEDVKVNKIVAWNYAYRAARPGPWEQMARDRVRFQDRILRLSPMISAILKKEHRNKIYKELYS